MADDLPAEHENGANFPPPEQEQEQEPAPAADANAPINVLFSDQAGNEVHFKLKPTTKLKKAMDAYSARQELARPTLRFLFDGTRVLDESTPASVSVHNTNSYHLNNTDWYFIA